MTILDHVYPRFGLACTLHHHALDHNFDKVLADEAELAKLTGTFIAECLNYYRLFTQDRPEEQAETMLRFRYVAAEDLATTKSAGQTSENYYY